MLWKYYKEMKELKIGFNSEKEKTIQLTDDKSRLERDLINLREARSNTSSKTKDDGANAKREKVILESLALRLNDVEVSN